MLRKRLHGYTAKRLSCLTTRNKNKDCNGFLIHFGLVYRVRHVVATPCRLFFRQILPGLFQNAQEERAGRPAPFGSTPASRSERAGLCGQAVPGRSRKQGEKDVRHGRGPMIPSRRTPARSADARASANKPRVPEHGTPSPQSRAATGKRAAAWGRPPERLTADQGTMCVPLPSRTAARMFSGEVMTASLPVALTKSTAANILGSMLPGAKCPASA